MERADQNGWPPFLVSSPGRQARIFRDAFFEAAGVAAGVTAYADGPAAAAGLGLAGSALGLLQLAELAPLFPTPTWAAPW